MAEEAKSSRFMLWFSAVILPVIGLGLYVYELFFKDAPNHKPGEPPAVVRPDVKREPPAEMPERLVQVVQEAGRLCEQENFEAAIELYERNIADAPENQHLLRSDMSGVYYKWARILYDRMQIEKEKGLEMDAGALMPIRNKLERCLETDPDGKYAENARQLLAKLRHTE